MPLIITRGLGNLYSTVVNIGLSSVVSFTSFIRVSFDTGLGIVGGPATIPSNWIVTPVTSGAKEVTITAVTINSTYIDLACNEQTNGATYTLTIPYLSIVSSTGAPFMGPYNANFAGLGVTPYILMAQVVDARTINIIFSEAVRPLDALDINNYSINNGLIVTASTQLGAAIFQLTTSHQVPGTSYTVTASNIRDLASNPV